MHDNPISSDSHDIDVHIPIHIHAHTHTCTRELSSDTFCANFVESFQTHVERAHCHALYDFPRLHQRKWEK